MTTALATVAELRERIDIEDGADDTQLQSVLNAASAWIESPSGCNRTFDIGASATKEYLPVRPGVVQVDDLVTVTSVKIDTAGNRTYSTTITLNTDYLLWPLNGPPYQELREWPTASHGFVMGRLVQVIGTFGYEQDGGVPWPVRQACLILAARWFKRNDAPFGIVGAADLGQMERLSKEDPDVVTLLEPYRRGRYWIVV